MTPADRRDARERDPRDQLTQTQIDETRDLAAIDFVSGHITAFWKTRINALCEALRVRVASPTAPDIRNPFEDEGWRNAMVQQFHDEWHHTKPADRKDIVRAFINFLRRFVGSVPTAPDEPHQKEECPRCEGRGILPRDLDGPNVHPYCTLCGGTGFVVRTVSRGAPEP